MAEEKTKGKIVLSGFKLDPAEKAIVDNLINNYKHKIEEKFSYKEIDLRMRKSSHGKTFLHEVKGRLIADKMFSSEATDYNLFAAISEVLDKIINELEHNKRTARQDK